jgi:threonine/homoserine/homoserine lactone efflux protein
MLLPSQLLAFLVASILLTIAPGPDVLATISIGLARGGRPAVSFGVGCALGCLLHTAAAVLGAAALLKTSPAAYTAMKLLGGTYLAWLGISIIRSTLVRPQRSPATPAAPIAHSDSDSDSNSSCVTATDTDAATDTAALHQRDFLRGLLANATNPKVAIFFLSFLPSFVRPGNTPPQLQLALLGTVFTAQAVIIFAIIGFFSGHCGRLLHSRPGLPRLLNLLCGLLFLALATLLLFE